MRLARSKMRNGDRATPMNGDLLRARDEIERTFERMLADPWGVIGGGGGDLALAGTDHGWWPAVDISESEKEVTVRVEAPGIASKDMSISVVGNALVISGEKTEEQERGDERFYRCERRFGSFRRSIVLPEGADPSKVTAESDNGVVTIRVAKSPASVHRQIEIKPTSRAAAAR